MDLVVAVFTILGNLALVITVLLVLRQLRDNAQLTRAMNSQTLVGLVGPFLLAQVQDRQLAELAFSNTKSYDALDYIDRQRYRTLLVFWLIFYENIYYQRRLRYLDRHAFLPWWRDLTQFIQEHHLSRHWGELQGLFQEEFARQVSELIHQMENQSDATPVTDLPSVH